MQLSELSSKLDNLLLEKEEQGILEVLSILIELSANNDLKTDLLNIRGNFHFQKRKYDTAKITNEEFKRYTANVLGTVYSLIYNQEDQWIISDWESHEVVLKLKQADEDIDLEDIESSAESEVIDNDNFERDIDNEIAIPKHTIIIPEVIQGLISEEEKKRYRRQVTYVQDLIRYGDYAGAYEAGVKVSQELEGESIQLQEFLLISLFKKTGFQEIVHDYLEGTGAHFLKLKLYAEKIISLSQLETSNAKTGRSKSPKETTRLPQETPTSATNIRLICRLLINEIRRVYLEKRFHGKKIDYLEQQEMPEIRAYYTKLIQMTLGVYSLHPMPTFFGTLLLELSGGGYMDWLRVDKNMKISDRENLKFSPLHYRRILYEEYAPKIFPGWEKDAFNKQAAYILLKVIRAKYVNIKKTRYRDRDGKPDWNMTWNAHQKSVQSFLTGFALFEDDRFLEKPLRELSGRAGMDWIDLDETGKLIIHKYCGYYLRKFDAVAQLKVLSLKVQPQSPETVTNDVVNYIASKKLKTMTEDYNRIQNALSYTKNKNEIKEVIRYVNSCKVCHALTGDPKFIHFAIKILTDKKKISWFRTIFLYGRLIVSNAAFCLTLKFDALLEMRKLELLTKSLHPQDYEEVDTSASTIESSLSAQIQQDSEIENLTVPSS